MPLRDLSLEMSIKAFRAQDGSDIDAVLRTMFRQWEPLVRQSDPAVVSVMLWTADGSEILDYRGEADAEIEWGRYIGYANAHGPVPNDPEGIDPHSRTYLYVEDPIRLTYGRLGHLVARIKALGRSNPDALFRSVAQQIQKFGMEKVAVAACEKIDAAQKKSVFLHFLDLLLSDGTVAAQEEKMALSVQEALGLDDAFVKNALELLAEKNKL